MKQLTLVPIPEMEKFPFGLQFFDEDDVMYVSPRLYEEVQKNNVQGFPHARLAYRKSQKTIQEVVDELISKALNHLAEEYSAGVLDKTEEK
jgi:malic enzyme